mmetsp:Transcript_12056/g.18910  ORF Transcript_12056/g.18910 Transcript_12056/m.18910 type:complete len:117 (-) Transcript_12056:442-792(-)
MAQNTEEAAAKLGPLGTRNQVPPGPVDDEGGVPAGKASRFAPHRQGQVQADTGQNAAAVQDRALAGRAAVQDREQGERAGQEQAASSLYSNTTMTPVLRSTAPYTYIVDRTHYRRL